MIQTVITYYAIDRLKVIIILVCNKVIIIKK